MEINGYAEYTDVTRGTLCVELDLHVCYAESPIHIVLRCLVYSLQLFERVSVRLNVNNLNTNAWIARGERSVLRVELDGSCSVIALFLQARTLCILVSRIHS